MQTPLLTDRDCRGPQGRVQDQSPPIAYYCPPQAVTYGTSVICFCIGCIWGLRLLGELTVPWLGTSTQYSLNECALYALWCAATALPCFAYLYAAEAIWAAANELHAPDALRSRRFIWLAFASATLKLALVLGITALSAEARGTNPYVLLETRIFMSMIVGIMFALFAMSCAFVRILKSFAKECDAPAVACLAESPL